MSNTVGTQQQVQGGSAKAPRPKVEVVPARQALPMGGSLDLLVTIDVEFPPVEVDRKPLDLALVIDRSGSMSGAPLEAAKRAAEVAVGMLLPGDRVAVVAYESGVQVVVPSAVVGADRSRIVGPIRTIAPGGSTALYAGWAEGLSQVLRAQASSGDASHDAHDSDAAHAADDVDAAIRRIVLLTDGMANVGPSRLDEIAPDVGRAAQLGVTTTTLGFGVSYDEHLLRGLADAGLGNYVYIEDASQLVGVFEQELAGLGALRGRQLRLALEGGGATLAHVARGLGSDARGLVLPDLVAGMPLDLLVRATIDAAKAGAAAATPPTLVLRWDDVLTGSEEEQRYDLALPWVDPAAFQRMPVDERVSAMVRAAELAEFKAQAVEAARQRDVRHAEASIAQARQALAAMPASALRDREAGEVDALEQQLQARAYEKLSRTGEQLVRNFARGIEPEKRAAMAQAEGEWRARKAAMAVRGAGTTPAAGDQAVWHRRDGAPVRVQLVLGDITDQAVDAIVNSSNRGLFGTAGVDGAIHRRGGPDLTAAARSIGGIDFGEAVFTPGFALPATYVIHTATPPWGTTGDELATLGRCYRAAFDMAEQLGARSVALPAIGTGTYQYPAAEAARVAVAQAREWVTGRSSKVDVVRFVVVDRDALRAYLGALSA